MPDFDRDTSDPFGSSSTVDISNDDLPILNRFDRREIEWHNKEGGRKRRKVDYIAANHIRYIDYKDIELLKRFISERGKNLADVV